VQILIQAPLQLGVSETTAVVNRARPSPRRRCCQLL